MPNIPEAPQATTRPNRSALKRMGAGLASLAVAGSLAMSPMIDAFKNAASEVGNTLRDTAGMVAQKAAVGLGNVLTAGDKTAAAGELAISGTAISNFFKSGVNAGVDAAFGIKKPGTPPELMKAYQASIGNQQKILGVTPDPKTNSVKLAFDEKMGPMQIRTEMERGGKNSIRLTQPNYDGGTFGLTKLEIDAQLDPASGAVIPASVKAAGVDPQKQPDRQAKAVALAQRQAATGNKMLGTMETVANNYSQQMQQKAAAQQASKTPQNMPATRGAMNYCRDGWGGGCPKP